MEIKQYLKRNNYDNNKMDKVEKIKAEIERRINYESP